MAAGCQVDEGRCTTSSGRLLDCNPCESGHFIARGIDSPAHNLTIDENQGQAFWAAVGEHLLNDRVLGKCSGLLCEVESFDRDAAAPEPFQGRSKPRHCRIDVRPAHAACTAHRRVEDLKDCH